MRWLADRAYRLRGLVVPLAAYVTVTLLLPAANGAAARPDFAEHAAWIVAACAGAALVALIGGELAAAIRRASGAWPPWKD